MKEFTKVAIRIFSLFFIARFAFQVTGIVYMIGDSQSHARLIDWIYYGLSMSLNVVIALTLWCYNDYLSVVIIGNQVGVDIKLSITYDELLNIALKIFGLILIVFSIESALRAGKNILDIYRIEYYPRISAYHIITFIDPIIKIVIGTVLLMRKRSVQESLPDLNDE